MRVEIEPTTLGLSSGALADTTPGSVAFRGGLGTALTQEATRTLTTPTYTAAAWDFFGGWTPSFWSASFGRWRGFANTALGIAFRIRSVVAPYELAHEVPDTDNALQALAAGRYQGAGPQHFEFTHEGSIASMGSALARYPAPSFNLGGSGRIDLTNELAQTTIRHNHRLRTEDRNPDIVFTHRSSWNVDSVVIEQEQRDPDIVFTYESQWLVDGRVPSSKGSGFIPVVQRPYWRR